MLKREDPRRRGLPEHVKLLKWLSRPLRFVHPSKNECSTNTREYKMPIKHARFIHKELYTGCRSINTGFINEKIRNFYILLENIYLYYFLISNL